MTDAESENDLTSLPIVRLDLPSARDLAGYVAVHQDMVFVRDCCTRLLQLLDSEESEPDRVLSDALWSTALVAYARSFKDGKREYRPQFADISALPLEGDVLEFHKHVIAMRDKHIAHSINPFEQVLIGAVLSPLDATDRQVEGVSMLSGRLVSHDRQGVWQLGHLAHAMANSISKKVEQQTAAVLADAQALNLEVLYTLPPLRMTIPESDAATRPRS